MASCVGQQVVNGSSSLSIVTSVIVLLSSVATLTRVIVLLASIVRVTTVIFRKYGLSVGHHISQAHWGY
jgi:hypothetical protein